MWIEVGLKTGMFSHHQMETETETECSAHARR